MFWSTLPGGDADAVMWHTGCIAREIGAHGRWAMQKFKTPAKGDVSSCHASSGAAAAAPQAGPESRDAQERRAATMAASQPDPALS